MHLLSSFLGRPARPASDITVALAFIDETAIQARLQTPNGPLLNDIQQRIFSYIPIEHETCVKALSRVSIQFYWNSRDLRKQACMYVHSQALQTAPIKQACMRLERIIIELTNVERGWNEENKSSILANAIRNALGPHRAKAYQLFAEEMEAAYFLALNARHITTPSNSGQVLLELICALPLVGRTRQDQARRGLLSAVNTINPDDNAGWHWRCRIHLLETESSTDAIACAFDDILSGIGKLPSTTQASLLAELIRYATKHHALFLVGSGTALNRYADFREKIRQLDVCDQPAVLAALAGMLASPPLAVEAPRLFITMYRDATALADPGSKALVLRSLMGVLHVCPQGNERRNVLCTIVDDALLLGDAYAAAVLCGMDPQMRISHFADHIERYVARFLESRIQRLASPYQREVSDKLFEFFEQFRRHNDMLLG